MGSDGAGRAGFFRQRYRDVQHIVVSVLEQIHLDRIQIDIDEDLLQQIAKATNARYFRATDQTSLRAIYDDIDKMEKTKTEVFHYMEYKEQFTRFALLGGAFLIEHVFSIPGMGNYLVTAITSRDYAVVQAGTLVVAIWFGLCILLMDILYALIDPRMRGSLARITSK